MFHPQFNEYLRYAPLSLVPFRDFPSDHVLSDRVKVRRLHTLPPAGLQGPRAVQESANRHFVFGIRGDVLDGQDLSWWGIRLVTLALKV